MGFSVNGYSVADPRIAAVIGRPGIGLSELCLSVSWQIHPSPRDRPIRIHSTQATVTVGIAGTQEGGFLGFAVPETAWFAQTYAEKRETALQYRLILSPAQIMGIERIRTGRAVEIALDLRGIVEEEATLLPGFAQCGLHLNPHDWAKILQDMGARDILFIGVDLPIENGGNDAIKAVRKAHEHLVSGSYDAAIAESRKAVESILKQYSLESRANKARTQLAHQAERERQTLFERRLAFAAVVQHFAHLSVHAGKSGEVLVFSREDAAMVVAAAAALVAAMNADAPSLHDEATGS